MDPQRRFDGEETARILRRASELGTVSDLSAPLLGADELVAAASEVGLPEAAVRRAIAIERLGDEPTPRRLDRIVGSSIVTATVEVAAGRDDAMRLVDRWVR